MGNSFLFLAYAFVWIIFMLYAWNLARRQARLRREIDELKASRRESAQSVGKPAG